ncbi:hypothetical protein Golomagni_02200 [Golovinomyces magnicellulatus]|nr:hypothetical protein Golomagni_02200 [Golovinomyces magnicellulatus]
MSKIPSGEPVIDETSISKSENSASNARRNSLEKHLKHRPNVQELKDRHILLNTNIAPSLQGQQKELEKSLLADTLNEKIINRPHSEDLIKRGILNEADKIYEERIEEEYAKREGGYYSQARTFTILNKVMKNFGENNASGWKVKVECT